jgi:hypothetical protein
MEKQIITPVFSDIFLLTLKWLFLNLALIRGAFSSIFKDYSTADPRQFLPKGNAFRGRATVRYFLIGLLRNA